MPMAAHGPHRRNPDSIRPRENVSSHSAGVRANTNQSFQSGAGLVPSYNSSCSSRSIESGGGANRTTSPATPTEAVRPIKAEPIRLRQWGRRREKVCARGIFAPRLAPPPAKAARRIP